MICWKHGSRKEMNPMECYNYFTYPKTAAILIKLLIIILINAFKYATDESNQLII